MNAAYVPLSEKILKMAEEVSGIDYIFTLLSWALLMIAGVGIYILAVTKVLPRFLLSPVPSRVTTKDRGIRKYVFPEGRAVVYEPELKYRRYVSKYALFTYNGNKYAKLNFPKGVLTAECELALYDNQSRQIKLMSVFCRSNGNGESQSIELPCDTAYASLLVRGVNGKIVTDERMLGFSAVRIAVFSAVTTGLTVALGYWIRLFLVFFGELVFSYAKYATDYGIGFALVVSAIAGALISFIGVRVYCNKKIFKVKK